MRGRLPESLAVLQRGIEERVAVEQADVALRVGEVARLLGERGRRHEEPGALVADRRGERLYLGRPTFPSPLLTCTLMIGG